VRWAIRPSTVAIALNGRSSNLRRVHELDRNQRAAGYFVPWLAPDSRSVTSEEQPSRRPFHLSNLSFFSLQSYVSDFMESHISRDYLTRDAKNALTINTKIVAGEGHECSNFLDLL
jgi:hypothetical protein